MIDRRRAVAIAAAALREAGCPEDVVIDEQYVVERPFGWAFTYNRRAFLERGDRRQRLVGNGPIIVRRQDGMVRLVGLPYTLWYCAQLYESGRL